MSRLRTLPASIAAHAILLVSTAFMAFPFVWMVSLSLKPPNEIFETGFHLLPTVWHAYENYRAALLEVPIPRFLLNGVLVCSAILTLQILVAVPAAYALARLKFREQPVLFALVVVGLIVPQQALGLPLFLLFHLMGLLDSYASLILPWIISPFAIFLLRQFFMRIPQDIVDAARLDGMTELEILLKIMVPAAAPAIGAFAIFSAVAHWNDLYWPLIVLQSQELSTPAVGAMLFRDDQSGHDFGPLMAGSVLIVAPLVIAFVLAQRWFIQGVTFTGIR